MRYINITFPTPAENLACDEALLGWCEEHGDVEVLRMWEPSEYFVVLGYANRASQEVELEACRALNVPALRRCSGGGTVVQGPGCLNYSLVLQIQERGLLQTITGANHFILGAHQRALASIVAKAIAIEGHTDLAIEGLKFSGNAQRRKRRCLLFHGTFLLEFDLAMIAKLLRPPSKQPAYRRDRPHLEFLTNLNLPACAIKDALRKNWSAQGVFNQIPFAAIERLAREKYSRHDWTFRFQ